MKIGILTFCNTVNYGAELQGYALARFLNNQKDVNAEVINYCNEAIYNSNRPKKFNEKGTIKQKIKRILAWKAAKERWDKFREFENNYMPLSNNEYNIENIGEIKEQYDRYIIGSDQVWNLDLNGDDITFFLPFIEDKDRIFTYAASFGYEQIPEKHYKRTKDEVIKLKHFLMREQSGLNIIKNLSEIKPEIVLDPTLLLESNEWFEFIRKNQYSKFAYILLYLVDKDNTDMWRFVKDYAKKNNLKILWITPLRNFDKPGIKIRTAGPDEFMNLIYHAELIVTGSFHAVCFSLQYSKNFLYVMKDKNKASRITNLLELLCLNNVIYSEGQNDIVVIDYSNVQNKLAELRKESICKVLEICNGE